jgi:glycosyltransferase involved in cell wall biosynthesis
VSRASTGPGTAHLPPFRYASPPPRRELFSRRQRLGVDRSSLRVVHHICINFGMTGVETFVLQLAMSQLRLGISPRVSLEVAGREQLVEGLAAAGIPAHPTPTRDARDDSLPQKLGTARLRARCVASMARLLRSGRIDVLHLHAVGIAGLDQLVAGALARVPGVVITHHTTLQNFGPVSRAADRATFLLEKLLARRVVMPYAAAARELVVHGVRAERVQVVPYCVDEQRFPLGAGRPAPSGVFRMVMLSRVFPRKGHAELLDAMVLLRDRCPYLKLRIIGDGELRAELEARAAALGLADRVEWCGWVPHARVPELLAEGDAVVLPSYMPGETFPLSLMEGMALGLPAIGSRWFGIPDLIGEAQEAGRLVEPGDAAGLAEAIAGLALEPAAYARASAAAVARVRSHFTGAVVGETYQRLYAEAIGGRQGSRSRPPGEDGALRDAG